MPPLRNSKVNAQKWTPLAKTTGKAPAPLAPRAQVSTCGDSTHSEGNKRLASSSIQGEMVRPVSRAGLLRRKETPNKRRIRLRKTILLAPPSPPNPDSQAERLNAESQRELKESPHHWFSQFAARQTSRQEQQMEFERSKEEEVNAAWVSFKGAHKYAARKGRSIPNPLIINQEFELFSSNHVRDFFGHSCNNLMYMPKNISFRPPDKDETKELLRNGVKHPDRRIFAEVLLYGFDSESFGPFLLPSLTTLDTLQIRSTDDQSVLWLQFFGQGYLKVRISRDLVYYPDIVASSNTPRMFPFVGILKRQTPEEVPMKRLEEVIKNPITIFKHEEVASSAQKAFVFVGSKDAEKTKRDRDERGEQERARDWAESHRGVGDKREEIKHPMEWLFTSGKFEF